MSQQEEKDNLLEVTDPGHPERLLALIMTAGPSTAAESVVGLAMLRGGVDAVNSSIVEGGIGASDDLRDWNLRQAAQRVEVAVEGLVDALAFGMATCQDEEDSE